MSVTIRSMYRARRIFLAVCTLLWIGAFVLTHLPALAKIGLGPSDKILHFVGYFGLTSIFLLTLAAYRHEARLRAAIAFTTMALYGALDELTQPWFHRCAAWGDWFADLVGTVAAIIVIEAIMSLLTRRKRRSRAT